MTEPIHFAVCVRNTGNEASLELRKLYQVLPDPDANDDGILRVIDESGEDYLFPSVSSYSLLCPQLSKKQFSMRSARLADFPSLRRVTGVSPSAVPDERFGSVVVSFRGGHLFVTREVA